MLGDTSGLVYNMSFMGLFSIAAFPTNKTGIDGNGRISFDDFAHMMQKSVFFQQ